MTTLTAKKLVAMAATQVGYTESPAGSNHTKYGKWYGMDPAPWCAMAVSWCFHKCDDLGLIHGKFARTDTKARALDKLGLFHKDTAGMKAGAIVFFNFGNHKFEGRFEGICHVGIWTGKKTADGRFITLEANTGSGSDANGGEYQMRYRSAAMIAGYFNPKYAAEPKPIVVPVTPKKTKIIMTTTSNVNFRTSPNAKSKTNIKKVLKKGAKLIFLGYASKTHKWVKTISGVTRGYVSAKYVDIKHK